MAKHISPDNYSLTYTIIADNAAHICRSEKMWRIWYLLYTLGLTSYPPISLVVQKALRTCLTLRHVRCFTCLRSTIRTCQCCCVQIRSVWHLWRLLCKPALNPVIRSLILLLLHINLDLSVWFHIFHTFYESMKWFIKIVFIVQLVEVLPYQIFKYDSNITGTPQHF